MLDFWKFAADRMNLFWTQKTEDPIFLKYRFTNCYRVLDRVSQYLVREIILPHEGSDEDLVFKICLFKTFNRISTWELLRMQLGGVRWDEYSFASYQSILGSREKIYSPAFRYASAPCYGHGERYQNHLRMVEQLVGMTSEFARAGTLKDVYQLLLSVPMIGPFMAYQYATDLNYSDLITFDENSFVRAGPGSRRGMDKLGVVDYESTIQSFVEWQPSSFPGLPGRSLHAIDVQNLFCEFDKYTRMTNPELNAVGRGKPKVRPKQGYTANPEPLERFVFPRKWRMPCLDRCKV